jgi:hypothetical protein
MLEKPFRPETRVVRRNGSPSLEESSADICVVGAGISAAITGLATTSFAIWALRAICTW